MSTTESDHADGPSVALEPWQPPIPPSARPTAFRRALIALRPGLLPVVVGALSWAVSAHGGGHSTGDCIAGIAVTAASVAAGILQTTSGAKKGGDQPINVGAAEPHTAVLGARAGLVAWAVAGLAALATIDVYTTNLWMRLLYTAIAAIGPIAYQHLTTRHHDEIHLQVSQRLALEESANRATITVEQLRQDGASTRTAVREEHATVRTRLTEDGDTTRTVAREQGETARALIGAYTTLAKPERRAAGAAPAQSAPAIPEHLRSLLALSTAAAEALDGEALELLGRVATTEAVQPLPQDEGPSPYI